ncbi:hypothetical protein ACFY4I_30845 [Streptomyces scabiei]|uniref:hypothetical protein n=1 Tax=Streptomyces scabiei TaxID=1930 RepID=UPI0036BE0A6B
MSEPELHGTYTYRSFLNRPEPVEDFNKLRFALRAKDHGSGAGLARAGQTASFLAVKRDA